MKNFFWFLFVFLSWEGSLWSQQIKVPHLINYQSVLTDPAGNPLPNGIYNVLFRIVDAQGNELYQERQNLETFEGVVSAMVGGAGDFSLEKLDPTIPKFLEVQVEGEGPKSVLEIVSVPYSLYSEQALSVAPESIKTESIQAGAITRDLIAEGVFEELLLAVAPESLPPVLVKQNQLQTSLEVLETSLQTSIARKLSKAGDIFEGNLSMGNFRITTVANPLLSNDVATKEYVDQAIQGVQEALSAEESSTPVVVAAGKVTYVGERDANLVNGFGVSEVYSLQEIFDANPALRFSGHLLSACSIHFSTPIATPYYIQVTPIVRQEANGDLRFPSADTIPIVHSQTTNHFVVDFLGREQDFTDFQFVVFQ